jgi:uncharacterized delta-60 repeat protein
MKSQVFLSLRLTLVFAWLASPSLQAQIGGFDPTFSPQVNGAIRAMATQSDGKIVIAGDFTTLNGAPCSRIARFNADGSVDTSFLGGTLGINGPIHCLAFDPYDAMYIGGEFTVVQGLTRQRIARLTMQGTLVTEFNTSSGANGTVYAMIYSPFARGLVVGGAFTSIGGSTRNHIAVLNGFGIPNFGAFTAGGANGPVYAMAVRSGNESYPYIVVGGDFTTMQGVSQPYLCKIDASSLTPVSGFNTGASAGPNGPVYAVGLFPKSSFDFSPDTFLIGGDFTTVNGSPHAGLALVGESNGVPVSTFTLSTDATVRSILTMPDPTGSTTSLRFILGGDFNLVDGAPRLHQAELIRNYISSSSVFWELSPDYTTPVNGTVRSLAQTLDGKVLLGGDFSSVDSHPQSYLTRLYGQAGNSPPATPSFSAVGPGTDTSLILLPVGVSYVLGYKIERSPNGVDNWTEISNSGSTAPFYDTNLNPNQTYFYRMQAYSSNGTSMSATSSSTTFATPWTAAGAEDKAFGLAGGSGPDRWIYATALQPNGKILAGGFFSNFNGVAHSNLVRLQSDGALDTSFNPTINGEVRAIAVQPDGKIVVAGSFSLANNVTRINLARLHPDGTLDLNFILPSGTNSSIRSLALQTDGKIVLGGFFYLAGGVSHQYLARVEANGSIDASFNPNPSSAIYSVAIQSDGKIVAGGHFALANGVARGRIARFESDGTLDSSFASGTGADVWIESVQILPDGRILIAGPFRNYDNTPRLGLARLLANGNLDSSFDPGSGLENGWAFTAAAQSDGKIIAGGWFTKAQGSVRLRIARFNEDGTLDHSFQPGVGLKSDVTTLVIAPDGKCLIGGLFASAQGTVSNYLARLLADNGPAAPLTVNNLTVSPLSSTTLQLTWNNVSFESGYKIYRSADGLNDWNLITTVPSNITTFTQTGLSVGSSASFRVRAYNTNGEAADSNAVTATTYTAYQQWKLDYALPLNTDDLTDPDGDGLSNLMEYALALNPILSSVTGRPVVFSNGSTLTLTYPATRADVDYVVEMSTDLIEWTSTGVDQGTPGENVTATVPLGPEPKKFLRLHVIYPAVAP